MCVCIHTRPFVPLSNTCVCFLHHNDSCAGHAEHVNVCKALRVEKTSVNISLNELCIKIVLSLSRILLRPWEIFTITSVHNWDRPLHLWTNIALLVYLSTCFLSVFTLYISCISNSCATLWVACKDLGAFLLKTMFKWHQCTLSWSRLWFIRFLSWEHRARGRRIHV